MLALSLRQQQDAVQQFAARDGCGEQTGAGLAGQPFHGAPVGIGAQSLGQDVGVENDHRLAPSGLRMGSRCASTSSTPPRGSTRARMESNSECPSAALAASAARKMLRASSSMEWPCRSACRRSRACRSSSRSWIVMVVMARLLSGQ
ncbi:cytochrome P450 3A10 [Corchorus olitorius]|uniref:Cytochrome P450 3A10 n=1 Tax=Corchorus olitorius TaxID=93759 RepID=A0A1R3L1D8_9ROSI|nr:cytochrome P450 3A10 [Corchorus olitorius]